jgi:two-component system catabolic regulation response regulator CreB
VAKVGTETILIVEDELAIAESLGYALRREGFATILAHTFADAWSQRKQATLLVLDLMLPDGSGLDLIEQMRGEASTTPIIVLSSRDGEPDRVAALEAGADDYVTKPFSPREVVARIRAVLRRLQPSIPSLPESLIVNPETRRATLSGQTLDLTRVEFNLLATLLSARGKVFTRVDLIDRVWGEGFKITDRTIDSHVKSLRRKVAEAGGDPNLIETVRGVGYRLAETETLP